MRFDFDTMMERHGMDSIAVDAIGAAVDFAKAPEAPKEGFDAIPMWVADMNFPTVPTIPEAIIKRTQHPAYGYFAPTDEYFSSIIRWHHLRNGVEGLKPEHIGYENGVLGCVASAMQAFTSPGEKFLMHSPTYIGFTHVLEDNGRTAELSPLVKDADGIWRMDYEDMDRRLKENHIHFAIFCSPHNPCGRVWERWEIEKAMEIFKANDVVVVSDEIWSDIILEGHKHIPTQSVSEDAKMRTIAIYAPSKTFNLAGLIGSYHIIYNPYLRDRVVRQSICSHYNEMNVLSMHALIGAYKDDGHVWADELCQTLSKNVYYAYDFVKENFPGVDTAKPEGTYMMFLHCEDYCKKTGRTIDEVIKAGWDVGVAWQQGAPFHDPWAIRMNFAVPYAYVVKAMERLKKYVFI
ncbi:MAG: aminotransferase class I/II-fold pyridoxal phosphate-dependent enzyme [Lachnospiraceae bacterium]|nr:aminotransferase class I/II-fold pyridoxal phosphate-dependent enzyme [Lachnospiraceae bacterium]